MTVPPASDAHGVSTLPSVHGVPELLDRLAHLAEAHGLTIFARIEFSRDARAVGRALPPMAQLVFGNPRSGTPVLAAAPLAGLDLPLRALAWTDAAGRSWLSYVTPETIAARHDLPEATVAELRGIHALCRAAAAADPGTHATRAADPEPARPHAHRTTASSPLARPSA